MPSGNPIRIEAIENAGENQDDPVRIIEATRATDPKDLSGL